MAKKIRPVAGKTYLVNHTRKGKFTMKVDNVEKTWISGVIVSGTERGIMKIRDVDDHIPVRTSFCTFHEE